PVRSGRRSDSRPDSATCSLRSRPSLPSMSWWPIRPTFRGESFLLSRPRCAASRRLRSTADPTVSTSSAGSLPPPPDCSSPGGSWRWRSASGRDRRSIPCSRRADMAPSASNAPSPDTIASPSGHTPAARRPRTQETEPLDQIHIEGGPRLEGEVRVSGSKNATLPLMAAALLGEGATTLRNVPDLADVTTLLELLRTMGVDAHRVPGAERHVVRVHAPANVLPEAPYDLVRKMRASVLVLGPLLGRFGRARVSLPGG